jgi:hypothetical protein
MGRAAALLHQPQPDATLRCLNLQRLFPKKCIKRKRAAVLPLSPGIQVDPDTAVLCKGWQAVLSCMALDGGSGNQR